MEDERAQFAGRLRAALRDAKIEASAAVLEKRFNSRYRGAPITAQAISGWLTGRHIPRQDKLQVLAELLGADPHFLQYGAIKGKVAEGRQNYPPSIAGAERRVIDAFLALPPKRRELVGELVAALQETRERD